MPHMLDELKTLRLYRGEYLYPMNQKDRLKNSIVYLFTPSTNSSIKVMNSPNAKKNQLYFKSYYLEKNIDIVLDTTHSMNEALNINDEIYEPSILLEMNGLINEDIYLNEAELYIRDGNQVIRSFNGPLVNSLILNEAMVKTKHGTYNFSNIFKRMLYNSRIKTQKEVLLKYDNIKEQVPYINFTYANPQIYQNKNVFYDWSYYTESFFKHFPKTQYRADSALDVFYNFVLNYLNYNYFTLNGYKEQTIVIPINDWCQGQSDPFNFKEYITPISMIWRFLRDRPDGIIQKLFNNKTVLFTSDNLFFTVDFSFLNRPDHAKLINLLKYLVMRSGKVEIEDLTGDSKKSIVIQLADKLEKEGNISLQNLSGGTDKMSKTELEDSGLLQEPQLSDDNEVKKAALVNKLEKIADKSTDIKDAEKQLENPDDEKESEWLKDVLLDLQSDNNGTKMNAARISRMNQARNDILTKQIKGKSIKDLLKSFKENNDIPESSIPIDNIDDHWKHVRFPNFNKSYDLRPDIVAMFMHFQDVTHPMNIVSLNVENTSTFEDYKETWSCVYEDAETGKRHTMTLDIPLLIGNRFMKLRGNEKSLIGQLMLLPIVKTDQDTVQIVSNYNKIFIRRKSPSGASKSTPTINKLVKALDKYDGKDFKVIPGDNTKISAKYVLPIDFADISGLYSRIKFKDGSYISFNMNELSKIPFDKAVLPKEDLKLKDEDLNKKYLGVYVKDGKRIPIFDQFDTYLLNVILEHDKSQEFLNLYSAASVAKRLVYAEASIMATKIPIAILLSYNIGLQTLLNKLGVKYEFSETRPSKDKTYIKFSDGYLLYSDTTMEQNIVLNGLMGQDFSDYSIKQINGKDMWLDILDDYGGKIKADGFDNFYDLMFDPITKEICDKIHLPNNYVDALIYGSQLLIDNSYNKHTDISGNRLRTNEVIVGHLYLVLSKAYGAYRNMIKRSKGQSAFSAKRDAVIDSILNHDQTSSDLSTLTPLLEAEAAAKVTFKGLSGMNSDRAFSIDKRTYDKSMIGILGLSTGFANTVGINRQLVIDAGITNKRGFISKVDAKNLDNLSTFTILEALSPLAVNHDDPIRTCMAFTQTVQHQMLVKKSMPNLITTGCDEALPYLTSNKFSYKFAGQRGIVTEVTPDYVIIQDLDTKEYDYIDTREIIQKNSDGGFYITTKLDAIVKKGDRIKNNQILAYNKACYSSSIGAGKNSNVISYNLGTLAKVAVMDTDLGYEDSCVVDNTISEALATEFVVQKELDLDKNTNVYNLVKVGEHIEEGDPLLVFQDAFDEKEANELLASLAKDNSMLTDLGRKQVHSKVTGTVQDIKIYRTCELDVLSPTLQKICKDYESGINKLKKVMDKYKVDKKYTLESTDKLPMVGKLKNTDGVKIEFYIKVYDKFGIGDKLVFGQALKGVNSHIVPVGQEAYTDFRPNEHINAFLTIDGVFARMVTSSQAMGLTNKALIELTRQCQEELGIKWRPLQEILQDEN